MINQQVPSLCLHRHIPIPLPWERDLPPKHKINSFLLVAGTRQPTPFGQRRQKVVPR